jgi:hypothetical protein
MVQQIVSNISHLLCFVLMPGSDIRGNSLCVKAARSESSRLAVGIGDAIAVSAHWQQWRNFNSALWGLKEKRQEGRSESRVVGNSTILATLLSANGGQFVDAGDGQRAIADGESDALG